jgi:glycosyltransferase involved in cell wall biosynthesis
MLNFYLIWSFSYALLLWLISRTWNSYHPKFSGNQLDKPVSLLIPIRNEIENLPDLVKELYRLSRLNIEIILIDDQSEDLSLDFLKHNLSEKPNIKILKSPGIGKKAAIEFGVKNSVGEIILCSDADCSFSSNWVEKMLRPFSNPEIQLVAGPVISMGDNTFFQRFQQIEWSSILLMSNYFFRSGNPIMCSAANLAYRKSAFQEVNGFEGNESFLSGDDEFLLKKITNRFSSESCVYLNNSEVLVQTKAMKDWSSLINQRVRWAGKWKAHNSLFHGFAALIPFFIQVIWLLSFFILIQMQNGLVVLLVCWAIKILAEKWSLGKVLDTYSITSKWSDALFTGIIHPIFVLWTVFGVIRGKFTWKGRDKVRSVILADKIEQ